MRCMSPRSAAWGMVLWAFAHIGSCISSEDGQRDFIAGIEGIENQVPGVRNFVSLLERLLGAARWEERFYGSYGVRVFSGEGGDKAEFGVVLAIYLHPY